MADNKIAYGTSTALTITLNSLASSATAGRESTYVTNATNLYTDASVTVILAIGAGTIANDQCAYVWAYGSEDATNYNDVATGSDAAITLTSPTQLRLLGTIAMPVQSLTYKQVFGSVGLAFGGILPRRWGIVVRNYCGIALSASGNSASYTGIYYTTT